MWHYKRNTGEKHVASVAHYKTPYIGRPSEERPSIKGNTGCKNSCQSIYFTPVDIVLSFCIK